jgi:hypothetical protein
MIMLRFRKHAILAVGFVLSDFLSVADEWASDRMCCAVFMGAWSLAK